MILNQYDINRFKIAFDIKMKTTEFPCFIIFNITSVKKALNLSMYDTAAFIKTSNT